MPKEKQTGSRSSKVWHATQMLTWRSAACHIVHIWQEKMRRTPAGRFIIVSIPKARALVLAAHCQASPTELGKHLLIQQKNIPATLLLKTQKGPSCEKARAQCLQWSFLRMLLEDAESKSPRLKKEGGALSVLQRMPKMVLPKSIC